MRRSFDLNFRREDNSAKALVRVSIFHLNISNHSGDITNNRIYEFQLVENFCLAKCAGGSFITTHKRDARLDQG